MLRTYTRKPDNKNLTQRKFPDHYGSTYIITPPLTAIDYVVYLQNQSRKQEEQLENLEKEVKALNIMKE